MATSTIPTRSNTVATNTTGSSALSDDTGPQGDPSTATGLLQERLQAWKHMCRYLEDYIKEVAKIQKSQSKDEEKILKTLSNPLREGHHFDAAIGGVSGLFENLRANTQAKSNLHTETSQNLIGQVLPILERLHSEVKNKSKELESGAGKGAKAVAAARSTTQKHLDALSSNTAHFDSVGGKLTAANDPYVLQRGVYHRFNKQILEENNNRQDIIAVQNSFQQFESHVITTVQTALNAFNQFMSGQADRQKAMFGDVASTASNIPLDFEWNGFKQRNIETLVNPNAPPEIIDNIRFPNQGHRSTKALIEGSLERKSRGGMGMLSGFKSNYYAVTPAGYLHEFKDNDNFHKDPTPEVSLYLPDCVIGAVDGPKFTIKGKDSSGHKISQKMAISSDFQFKAHTAADAQQWHHIIADQCSGQTASVPTSPVESRNITPIATQLNQPQDGAHPAQEQGVISPTQLQSATVASPAETSATPVTGTQNTLSPTSPTQESGVLQRSPSGAGDGKHYHSGPATSTLGEREYVSKQ